MALDIMSVNIEGMEPHIEKRLEAVSTMVAAKMTQRAIVRALKENGFINPETQAPYSLSTINTDIKRLKKEWRKRRDASTDTWLAEELSSLDVLEQKAWAAKEYDLVLKIKARRSKYLGLDKPAQLNLQVDYNALSDEQLEALASGKAIPTLEAGR